MTPLINLVGFDYAQAIRELNQAFTYSQLAKELGYDNKASITAIRNGSMPSHIHGEALWALYCDTFGHKPKLMRTKQTMGNLILPRGP